MNVTGLAQVVPPPPEPACVTETVRVMPPPVTVTVPVRAVVAVFAVVAFTVIVALLEPEAGETVIQVWSSLTVHDTFDVTENVPVNWDLVDIVCDAEGDSTFSGIVNGVEIDLAEGDAVLCTFFNVEEDTPPPPPGDDDDAADDDDDSDVGGVRRPRTSDVGGVRSPGKPGVSTGDGSFEPFTSFKDSADATSTWLPALGFLAAMGLAGMAVAHVYRRNGR